MSFKSTKYAKIMTDAKKYRLFDNIRFPQITKKKKFAYRSERPDTNGKNLF